MENNKQSSVDWLEEEFVKLESTIGVQGVFYELLEQAKAMHKEETLKLYYQYEDYVLREEGIIKTFGQFYNETFGGNNEQQ